ncbi:unnamed protein product [Brassica oleracea var. botrytis]
MTAMEKEKGYVGLFVRRAVNWVRHRVGRTGRAHSGKDEDEDEMGRMGRRWARRNSEEKRARTNGRALWSGSPPHNPNESEEEEMKHHKNKTRRHLGVRRSRDPYAVEKRDRHLRLTDSPLDRHEELIPRDAQKTSAWSGKKHERPRGSAQTWELIPPSKFPWTFSTKESCYLLEGKVKVYPDGSDEAVEIEAGDLVVFPKGLSCTWDVSVTVDKHYYHSE